MLTVVISLGVENPRAKRGLLFERNLLKRTEISIKPRAFSADETDLHNL